MNGKIDATQEGNKEIFELVMAMFVRFLHLFFHDSMTPSMKNKMKMFCVG
jgi:hypothetical protein